MLDNALSAMMATPAGGIAPSKGVCRCLFGAPDPGENTRTLARINKLLSERDNAAWNFDFSKETPLYGGRYSWEKVTEDEVPEAYQLSGLSTTAKTRTDVPTTDNDNTETCTSVVPSSDEQTLSELNSPPSQSTGPVTPLPWEIPDKSSSQSSSSDDEETSRGSKRKRSQKQTSITEYYRKCKKNKTTVKS